MNEQLQNISVLIVEDEPALNEAYGAILQAAGITAETSFDGVEALEKLKSKQPDIILLDLRMPNMDGLEFLKKLSALKLDPKPKIILFSNFDDQKDIDRAYKLGADRYMLKAWVSPKQLIKLIQETL